MVSYGTETQQKTVSWSLTIHPSWSTSGVLVPLLLSSQMNHSNDCKAKFYHFFVPGKEDIEGGLFCKLKPHTWLPPQAGSSCTGPSIPKNSPFVFSYHTHLNKFVILGLGNNKWKLTTKTRSNLLGHIELNEESFFKLWFHWTTQQSHQSPPLIALQHMR
jgi:hypothetical protein